MANIARKFVSGTIWQGSVQFINFFLSFGTNIVLARLLMPEDFGTYFLAVSVVSLFYILASWSFPTAIIQTEEIDQEFLDTAYWLSLALGVFMFLVILGASFLLKRSYSDQVIKIILISSGLQILSLLSACYGATIQRELEYRKYSIVEFVGRIIPMVGVIAFAVLGFGVWSFVGRQILSVTVLFFGMRFISQWRFKWHFSRSAARRIMKFCSQMFFARGLEAFIGEFKNFIVGTKLGETNLGYFKQASMLAELGHRFGGTVTTKVSLSTYARLQTSEEKSSKAVQKVNYFFVRISAILSCLILLFGEEITVLFYGEKWRMSGKVLEILFMYTFSVTIFDDIKAFLYAQGHLVDAIKTRVVQAIILALGMLLILSKYGVLGAAAVVDLISIVGLTLLFFFASRYININFRQLFLAPILSAIFVVFSFKMIDLFWLKNAVAPNIWISAAILLTLLYFGIIYLLEKDLARHNLRYLFNTIKGAKDNE